MEYDALVRNIDSCEILKKAVEKMAIATGALNLVSPDWETNLENYRPHKMHLENKVKYSQGHACCSSKAYIRNVIRAQDKYNVIVTGSFSIDAKNDTPVVATEGEESDHSFVTRSSEPLTRIAEAMIENPLQNLNDGSRFFVENCNPMLCHKCVDSHRQRNIPIPPKNWCVLSTRVFDGKRIRNDFKTFLIPNLLKMGSVFAVLHVQIYSRTTFGDNCFKIGGKIKEMIFFQCLRLLRAMN